MRNSKIVALVATAALLVLGAAFTSFAATYTWYQVDGIWHCKDKDGDDYTQAWAKSGSDMYWLDENGEMATDLLIDEDDDLFYVDAEGKMVKNNWVKVENDDDSDDEYSWYYFKASGKAQKSKNAKPVSVGGKKYLFAEDGKMLYGWVEDGVTKSADDYPFQESVYYCGDEDDGAVRTGWQQLDVDDPDADDTAEQTYWFYFGADGKKVAAKTGAVLLEKTINGKKYAFDEHGVMKAEWEPAASTSSAASASISSYAWFHTVEDGSKLKKGWFRVIPTASVNEAASDEEEEHWFYAKGAGVLAMSEVKTIKGKKYAFNEKGEMLSGLVCLVTDPDTLELVAYDVIDTEAKAAKVNNGSYGWAQTADEYLTGELHLDDYNDYYWSFYFLGDEETDGAMKTGTVKTEIDGDEYTYYFNTTGAAKYEAKYGMKGSNWYVNGAKLCADADYRYQAFEAYDASSTVPANISATTKLANIRIRNTYATSWNRLNSNTYGVWYRDADGNEQRVECKTHVLISSSGAIVKNATAKKDADGRKYKVENYNATAVAD